MLLLEYILFFFSILELEYIQCHVQFQCNLCKFALQAPFLFFPQEDSQYKFVPLEYTPSIAQQQLDFK